MFMVYSTYLSLNHQDYYKLLICTCFIISGMARSEVNRRQIFYIYFYFEWIHVLHAKPYSFWIDVPHFSSYV